MLYAVHSRRAVSTVPVEEGGWILINKAEKKKEETRNVTLVELA